MLGGSKMQLPVYGHAARQVLGRPDVDVEAAYWFVRRHKKRIALPLTEQTHHTIDADLLARMRPGALLVNIGRGPLVDTDALLVACGEGRIRAALDVVEPEPLPPEHPLWTTPGVLLTPHVAGRTTSMTGRVVELVCAERIAELERQVADGRGNAS